MEGVSAKKPEPTPTKLIAIRSAVATAAFGLFVGAVASEGSPGFALLMAIAAFPFFWPIVFGVWYMHPRLVAAADKAQKAAYHKARRDGGELADTDPAKGLYGTAKWATYEALAAAGHFLDPDKKIFPWFGDFLEPDRQTPIPGEHRPLLGYGGEGHILTVAPTRTGKGATQIIPNLLTWRGPVIVNDIKGENFDITSRYRSEEYGPVYALAPFRANTSHYNPLDEIDHEAPDGWESAALLAEMMIVPAGGRGQTFWEQEGRALLTGVIMHVCMTETGPKRSIAQVRELLAQDTDGLNDLIAEMLQMTNPQIRRAANTWLQKDGRVRSDVLATLNSQMAIWDSPRLIEATSKSDFRFADIKRDGKGSVYLVVPPDQVQRMAPFLRLVIGMALRVLMRTQGIPGAPPVLFILDEFTALGRMAPIENGLLYLAGYGVKLWMFAQDLDSLASVYSDPVRDSFVSNCGAKVFFGINSDKLASDISRAIGQTTVLDGRLDNPSVTGKPLVRPEEIKMLPANAALVFIERQAPALAKLVPYYKVSTYEGLYDTWKG